VTAQLGQRGRGRGRGRGWGRGRGSGRGGKRGASYAVLHGQKRGTRTGAHDAVTIRDEPPLSDEAPAEGLFVFIQTTICRRKVLEKIFKNAPSSKFPAQHHQPCSLLTTYTDVPAVSCCDLCNSSLLDRIRPGQLPAMQRQSTVKRGVANDAIRDALYAWRRTIKRQYYPKAVWAPQAILDNGTCELLASVGPITTIARLAQLIQSTWH
jgi:hypothetical protein